MKKSLFISVFTLLVSFVFGGVLVARAVTEPVYPIAELGACTSKDECRAFCDKAENKTACTAWGQTNGIVKKTQLKKVLLVDSNKKSTYGPGSCNSQESCKTFCDKTENQVECINFAVKKGALVKSVATEIKNELAKKGPNGCDSKESCNAFCALSENVKICAEFAVEQEKLTEVKAQSLLEKIVTAPIAPAETKAAKVLLEGTGPGACKTVEECATYCSDVAHMSECLEYAETNGLMSKNELSRAEKLLNIKGPGNCEGPEVCAAYCADESHQDECLVFAKKNNLLTAQELQIIQDNKAVLKDMKSAATPGGCTTVTECAGYCVDINHLDECLAYVQKTGLVDDSTMKDLLEKKDLVKEQMKARGDEKIILDEQQLQTIQEELERQLENQNLQNASSTEQFVPKLNLPFNLDTMKPLGDVPAKMLIKSTIQKSGVRIVPMGTTTEPTTNVEVPEVKTEQNVEPQAQENRNQEQMQEKAMELGAMVSTVFKVIQYTRFVW